MEPSLERPTREKILEAAEIAWKVMCGSQPAESVASRKEAYMKYVEGECDKIEKMDDDQYATYLRDRQLAVTFMQTSMKAKEEVQKLKAAGGGESILKELRGEDK